jgi:hypothetical protein
LCLLVRQGTLRFEPLTTPKQISLGLKLLPKSWACCLGWLMPNIYEQLKYIYIINVHCKLTNSTNRLKIYYAPLPTHKVVHTNTSSILHKKMLDYKWTFSPPEQFVFCFSWLMGECLKPELTPIKYSVRVSSYLMVHDSTFNKHKLTNFLYNFNPLGSPHC